MTLQESGIEGASRIGLAQSFRFVFIAFALSDKVVFET